MSPELAPAAAGRSFPALARESDRGRGADSASDPVAAYLAGRFPGFTPGPGWQEADRTYPALAAPAFLALIRRPERDDPVFAQVAPGPAELEEEGGEDPVGEEKFMPVPGLIHRYPDRALLLATTGCFVHCRHCMRKRLWRQDDAFDRGPRTSEELSSGWVKYLGRHSEVREVILSGGDPLTLTDAALEDLLVRVRTVAHVQAIRVHSRALVAAPGRITPALAGRLRRRGVARLVTQFNHPVELSPGAVQAVKTLQDRGIMVDNQAVLLRGVNDRARTLADLFLGLARARVRPYYLHHPDPVAGAMHFTLPLEQGFQIFEQTRRLVPAGLLPAYVVDRLGPRAKTRVEEVVSVVGGPGPRSLSAGPE